MRHASVAWQANRTSAPILQRTGSVWRLHSYLVVGRAPHACEVQQYLYLHKSKQKHRRTLVDGHTTPKLESWLLVVKLGLLYHALTYRRYRSTIDQTVKLVNPTMEWCSSSRS